MFHKQDDGQRIETPPGSTITVQYHLHAIVFYHTWIFATNRSFSGEAIYNVVDADAPTKFLNISE
jgi:hypothetical protein